VTFAFILTERADQIHHDNAPAHSTALVQAFLTKHHIIQVCHIPYSRDLSAYGLWLFPKLKSLWKMRRFLNAKVTSSVKDFSLPTD
jgi:hypothetical protein